jgi:hypothetical protein
MTWFDDLIEDAMPYLATEELSATQGVSWQWTYTVDDASADLGASYTATAVIKKAVTDVSSVVTVSTTFPAVNQVRCTVTPANAASVPAGRYLHEVEISRTSDGRCLKVVGGGDSQFIVKPQVGA